MIFFLNLPRTKPPCSLETVATGLREVVIDTVHGCSSSNRLCV